MIETPSFNYDRLWNECFRFVEPRCLPTLDATEVPEWYRGREIAKGEELNILAVAYARSVLANRSGTFDERSEMALYIWATEVGLASEPYGSGLLPHLESRDSGGFLVTIAIGVLHGVTTCVSPPWRDEVRRYVGDAIDKVDAGRWKALVTKTVPLGSELSQFLFRLHSKLQMSIRHDP
jgi:hypothetical protein